MGKHLLVSGVLAPSQKTTWFFEFSFPVTQTDTVRTFHIVPKVFHVVNQGNFDPSWDQITFLGTEVLIGKGDGHRLDGSGGAGDVQQRVTIENGSGGAIGDPLGAVGTLTYELWVWD